MNQMTPVVAGGLTGLRAPFPAHQISKLPKETKAQIDARKADRNVMVFNCQECGGHHHKNATHLDYVGHAALTDRLLDVDPAWSWEPVADAAGQGFPVVPGGMWIKLTVEGISRYGFGCADGKTGGDAIKEVIGDALRNAAMRFGAALDLWHKGDLHPEDDEVRGTTGAENTLNQEAKLVEHQPGPALIDDGQYTHIVGLIEGSTVTAKEVCDMGGIPSIKQLPASKFKGCVRWINDEIKARAPAASDILDDEVPY